MPSNAPSKPWRLIKYSFAAVLVSLLIASGWIVEEEYTLATEIDAPIDDVY